MFLYQSQYNKSVIFLKLSQIWYTMCRDLKNDLSGICFKVFLLEYETFHGLAPSYLSHIVKLHNPIVIFS